MTASPLRDAAKYWEPRRIGYNIALTIQVLGWILLTWPHFQPVIHFDALLRLLVLGLIANVLYSAAYLLDLPMQEVSARWRDRRWILYALGVLFALFLEFYWIGDEIYPYVR